MDRHWRGLRCSARLAVARRRRNGPHRAVPRQAPDVRRVLRVQRILHESGALAREHGETFPELAALHGSLARLYHDAKLARRGPGGPEVDTKPMEAAAAAIAWRFGLHAAGATFATKLANAAPFLVTFVNLPGVDPTNNESERMLRKVVIARKIRFRIASLEGVRTLSNIMTCMLTWRKRNLNVSDMLLKVLSGT